MSVNDCYCDGIGIIIAIFKTQVIDTALLQLAQQFTADFLAQQFTSL